MRRNVKKSLNIAKGQREMCTDTQGRMERRTTIVERAKAEKMEGGIGQEATVMKTGE